MGLGTGSSTSSPWRGPGLLLLALLLLPAVVPHTNGENRGKEGRDLGRPGERPRTPGLGQSL